MARSTPEINGSSLADIAFLLLIFFLVTTTMNVDTGLQRLLPPMPEEQTDTEQDVKQRNILTVLVNKSDRLSVGGEPTDISMLREKTREFLTNPNNDIHLPEKQIIDIEYLGPMEVCKGVISLQNDNGTSYKMYMIVQNELIAANDELRDELSTMKFGKKYDKLAEDEQKAIQKVFPLRISEAEPKAIGGRK